MTSRLILHTAFTGNSNHVIILLVKAKTTHVCAHMFMCASFLICQTAFRLFFKVPDSYVYQRTFEMRTFQLSQSVSPRVTKRPFKGNTSYS